MTARRLAHVRQISFGKWVGLWKVESAAGRDRLNHARMAASEGGTDDMTPVAHLSSSAVQIASSNDAGREANQGSALSEQQKARIAANRKRALELREEAERLKREREAGPKCEKCGSDENIVQSYIDTFQVVVCVECGRKDEMYALINKTTAKEEYLVTDDTLNFLKHTTKNNPMKAGWAPMKLYLTKVVLEASMKRWGDKDALEDEKERRALQKTMREKEKVRDVAQSISSEVNTVAAASGADPASKGAVLGGFEIEGDEKSGAIFNKMIEGIDETMKDSTKIHSPSSSKAGDSGTTSSAAPEKSTKKKAKLAFQTYNQAVMDQQDEKGLRLLAKAESRGGGGKKCPQGAGPAEMSLLSKKKRGGAKPAGANPLAAMIKSIRGDK